MYAENILDHYRNPKNFGKLGNPDATYAEHNPLCGDHYEFQMKFNKDSVSEIKFSGDGCAISMASASMLSDFVKGKNVSDISEISEENLLKLLGINVSPARMKCALLPLEIVKKCVKNIRSDI